jgi:hypothetical protein
MEDEEDNIKMGLMEIGCVARRWIQLSELALDCIQELNSAVVILSFRILLPQS